MDAYIVMPRYLFMYIFFQLPQIKDGEAGEQEKVVEESAGHEGECLSLS